MAIVKLHPAFKDYIWGGTKLKELYNKKTDMDPLAESWELSTHFLYVCTYIRQMQRSAVLKPVHLQVPGPFGRHH